LRDLECDLIAPSLALLRVDQLAAGQQLDALTLDREPLEHQPTRGRIEGRVDVEVEAHVAHDLAGEQLVADVEPRDRELAVDVGDAGREVQLEMTADRRSL